MARRACRRTSGIRRPPGPRMSLHPTRRADRGSGGRANEITRAALTATSMVVRPYPRTTAGGVGGPGSPCAAGRRALPLRIRSLMPSSATKNTGTNGMASSVEAIIPPNTTVPMACWLAAPAPVATISGTTPRIKANEVITMGRNRRRVASTAASMMDRPIPEVEVAGELHDEDRVLARERDHEHQADLGVQVVVVAAAHLRQDDTHKGDGNDEDDRGGRRPALVERGQHHVDQDDGKRVDEVRLVADLFLLVARGGPVVRHAFRQRLRGQLLHGVEGLAGAEARSGRPEDGRRRIEIVASDQLGALHLPDLDQAVQRDHLSVLVSNVEVPQVVGLQTIGVVGLDVDLEHLVELVEEVDE